MAIGLVGPGRWGRALIGAVEAVPETRLVAVAGRGRGTDLALPAGCRYLDDWRALVEAPQVDAVIVSTPPASHAEMAAAVVRAGKPLLLEKPVATGVAAAEALLELAERHRGTVLVDFVHLFHPAWPRFTDALRCCGRLLRLETIGGNAAPPARNGVPTLWEYGPHELAFCFSLLAGEPTLRRVDMPVRLPAEQGGGAVIEAEIDFDDGVTAWLRFGDRLPAKTRLLRAIGRRGRLDYDDLHAPRLSFAPAGGVAGTAPPIAVPTPEGRPLSAVVAALAQATREGRHDLSLLRLAVRQTRLLAEMEARLAGAAATAGPA